MSGPVYSSAPAPAGSRRPLTMRERAGVLLGASTGRLTPAARHA
ncbi:MAG TPA: hypothetical protein VNK04_21665 [Gemmataceae bacterium]|nr:hypothetical protein [Gemmataceae bacterium]